MSPEKATIHYLNNLEEIEDLDDEIDNVMIKTATEQYTQGILRCKRGDIIACVPGMYRNSTKIIFDGVIFEALSSEIDTYGYVPIGYRTFDEFPFDYWGEVIEHNHLVPVYLSETRKSEILGSMKFISSDETKIEFSASLNENTVNFVIKSSNYPNTEAFEKAFKSKIINESWFYLDTEYETNRIIHQLN